MSTWQNWGGNVTANPTILRPTSAEEVQALVTNSQHIKAVGAGHSFTSIAATDGVLLKLTSMNAVVEHDAATNRVRVQAGMSLNQLNRELLARGLAMPNLGDVDPQSVAGATSTGTHGTGAKLRGIADAIVALQLVTAAGDILEIDENHPWFNAARVGLGALGIVTEITLQCVPAYLLHANERPMPLPEVLANMDSLADSNDHFEFFWFPHTEKALIKENNRVPEGTPRNPLPTWRYRLDDEFLSNTLYERIQRLSVRAPKAVPTINKISGSLLGARQYTDHSHEVFISPRRVRFCEAEFALPREAAREAIGELQKWIARTDERISFPIEVRFAASDDIWMSTGYQRDNVYIALHQYQRKDFAKYFAATQDIFTAHEGRPHWGKMHSLGAEYFESVYPKFNEFVAIRNELDPERRFSNEYLDRVLG
ncbi:MAG: FAD-binding protein [Aeromicrobium sp.]|nr:MAG: FAD-binding protein [Aeromicrobium sp.]